MADDLGMSRCNEQQDKAALAAIGDTVLPTGHPWAAPLFAATCVGEREVAMIARLEDETARLGHFARLYPAAGSADDYNKYWLHGGLSTQQRLANAWVITRTAQRAPGYVDRGDPVLVAAQWLADLRAGPGEDFVRLSQLTASIPPQMDSVGLPDDENGGAGGLLTTEAIATRNFPPPSPAPLLHPPAGGTADAAAVAGGGGGGDEVTVQQRNAGMGAGRQGFTALSQREQIQAAVAAAQHG